MPQHISTQDLLTEARRILAERRAIYPHMIRQHQIGPGLAAHRIALAEYLVLYLQHSAGHGIFRE